MSRWITHSFHFLSLLLISSNAFSQTEWLVKSRNNISPIHSAELQGENLLLGKTSQEQLQVWEMRLKGRSIEVAQKELQAQHPHLIIEPNFTYSLTRIPNDPEFHRQPNLYNNGQNGCINHVDINVSQAWDVSTGSPNEVIVIIDGGMDLNHEDLVDNLWQNPFEIPNNNLDDDGNGYIDDIHGWDFANNDNKPDDDTFTGHGTHVAGIIGAKGNNGKGIAGICWNAQLMPLKFTDETGRGKTSNAIAALEYAIDMRKRGVNISVINNSWGGGDRSEILYETIKEAEALGILFVAAAGNDNQNDNDQRSFYPASYNLPNIISVAASDCKDELASFSNFGVQSVDLVAPGEAIMSTLPGNKYGIMSGTSMAAPHVTGAAVLLASRYDGFTYADIKSSIFQATISKPLLVNTSATAGRLSVDAKWLGGWKNIERPYIEAIAKENHLVWLATDQGLKCLNTATGNITNIFTIETIGLETLIINDITIDHQGTKWLATQEKGIIQYKGNVWNVLNTTSTPSIPDNHIKTIGFDPNGILWTGTANQKLLKFDEQYEVERVFDLQDSLINGIIQFSINDMIFHGQDVWISSEANGFIKYDDDRFWFWYHSNNTSSGFPASFSNELRALAVLSNGRVWVGGKGGLLDASGRNWRQYHTNHFVQALAVDQSDALWIGMSDGLKKQQGTRSTDYSHLLPDKEVTALHIDDDNNVWVATVGGLVRIQNTNATTYQSDEWQIPHGQINALSLDLKGILWVGSQEQGLYSYDGNSWVNFNTNNSSIASNHINALNTINDSVIRIGNLTEGLTLYYPQTETWETHNTISTNGSLTSDYISSIAEDHQGILWIGTDFGLTRFDGIQWAQLNALSGMWLETINMNSNADMWLGGNATGVIQIAPNFQITTHYPYGNRGDQINKVIVDNNQNVWVGSLKGLAKYDGTTWEINLLAGAGLPEPNPQVTSLAIDEYGALWVGTAFSGLCRYAFDESDVSFTIYNSQNSGLPSNNIVDVVVDSFNKVWVATDQGLAVLEAGATAAFRSEHLSVCQGESLEFTNTGLQGDTYEWFIDNTLVDSTRNFSWSFSQAGNYLIKLTTHIGGVHSSFEQHIEVHPPVTVDLVSDTSTLAAALQLDGTVNGGLEYLWSNSRGDTISKHPIVSIKESDRYYLSITGQCGYTAYDSIQITVNTDSLYVLPGDVNVDGAVNLIDWLLIGLNEGATGPERENPSSDFIPQPAFPWNFVIDNSLASSTNAAHLDTDGDGTVNIEVDEVPIQLNHNSGHLANHEVNSQLTLGLKLNETEIEIGEQANFEFYLAGDSSLIREVYGIAASVFINASIPDAPNPAPTLTEQTGTRHIYLFDQEEKRIDYGFTYLDSISQTESSPNSLLGRGGIIIVVENIDTTRILAGEFPMTFTLGNVSVIRKDGSIIPVNPLMIQRTHTVMVNVPKNVMWHELRSFEASCQGGKAWVSWTSYGNNIDYYEVEKSLDNLSFETIATVQAQTNVNLATYEFTEQGNVDVFYRLKIVGKDGSIRYSHIISLEQCPLILPPPDKSEYTPGNYSATTLYPNPTKNHFFLHLPFLKTGNLNLRIYNVSGQLIYSENRHLLSSNSHIPFKVTSINKGIYMVQAFIEDEMIFSDKLWIE